MVALVALYVTAPSVKIRIRDALPGAFLATIAWLILAETFSLYLQYTANSLNTYGVLNTFFYSDVLAQLCQYDRIIRCCTECDYL